MRLRVRPGSNQSFLSIQMRLNTVDSQPRNALSRMRGRLAYVRDWPENSDGPYSLMLCLSLLLALGVIIEIGH